MRKFRKVELIKAMEMFDKCVGNTEKGTLNSQRTRKMRKQGYECCAAVGTNNYYQHLEENEEYEGSRA